MFVRHGTSKIGEGRRDCVVFEGWCGAESAGSVMKRLGDGGPCLSSTVFSFELHLFLLLP